MNEVDNVLEALNLQPFEDQIVSEEPPTPSMQTQPAAGVPLLTKTQRRMSLDLIHSKPYIAKDPTHSRTSSFSKPALPSTSTVNVTTKAEIRSVKSITPQQKSTFPDKNRFSLNAIIPRRSISEQSTATQETAVVARAEDKRQRRLSLVGEYLPTYIKRQLDAPAARETPRQAVKKKQSRMHNILANSQSLYAHKDVESERSGSQTNTSDYENANGVYDSDDSDDKEYISPNAFTRVYGIPEEQEEGADDFDSDRDFVNVNASYEALGDAHHDTANNSDNNDDYLFAM